MLQIEGPFFKDKRGRTLMLRGINLGGNSRTPQAPRLPSHEFFGVYTQKVSFVNHPFPLKEADKHFKRLKAWGFNLIRFLVTWEAIESAGPKEYDEKYLDYVYEILKKAKEYGFFVIVDPHQDAWSRFCGGNGAPKWTHDLVGLNVEQFTASEAAVLHHHLKDDYPDMIWPTNYARLACASLFTLFFGGNHFAPQLRVEEKGIQDYLQEHYINAFARLANRIKDLDHIIGFEVMNDPSPGWIGQKDLNAYAYPLKRGLCPSPLECMVLGAGNPRQIEKWETTPRGAKSLGKAEANPRGIKVWSHGNTCIWKEQGIWKMTNLTEPTLLKPDHFSKYQGKEVNFQMDYLFPFIEKFAHKIRENIPDALIFLNFPANETPVYPPATLRSKSVYSPHWFEELSYFTKKFRSWLAYDPIKKKVAFGRKKVKKLLQSEMERLKKTSMEHLGNIPTLIGETGVPFDMNQRKALKSNHFKGPAKAFDQLFQAFEAQFMHICLWNYTPNNSIEHGDQWNKEDFSIYSPDHQMLAEGIYSGTRAAESWLRPFPVFTSGTPLKLQFDRRKKIFEYEFEHDDRLKDSTEIFVPHLQYPDGFEVFVSDGEFQVDKEKQRLIYHYSQDRYRHIIKIVSK